VAVLSASRDALALGNAGLAGDGGCAAELAAASLACAAYNVRANHPYMRNATQVEAQRSTLASLEAEGSELLARIRAGI
jgi:formiminotetrahydrofolate cyclodeaminase